MNINIENLDNLKLKADKIFISPEGEEVLIQLLDLRQQVEDAIDVAKTKLEEKGLELDPNFNSIQASKVKVYYRAFGARYKIDPSFVDQLPKNLYKTSTKYDAVAEEIEKYVEGNKGLPLGIIEADRTKTLTFSLKGQKDDK